MFGSYFTAPQQFVLATAFAGSIVSAVLYVRRRPGAAVVLLTATAFILRLFAAGLDPYLNEWDECFHALVAKNMMNTPFTPRLHVEAAMPLSGTWPGDGVWLHKPPFFLWQISLSLKVFGIHPWAVRIPSAIWLAAIVPVVYRTGVLLTGNRTAAFIAAFFTTFSYYLEELCAGAVTTDHNDAITIATVTCSWWAMIEQWRTGRWTWTLAAGLFSACAILTKWYIGLSAFVPWVIFIGRVGWPMKAMLQFVGASCVAIVPAGLWTLSTFMRFPELTSREMGFNTDHVSEAVEGHVGDMGYHFSIIAEMLPPYTWWLVLSALILLAWRTEQWEHRMFVVVMPIIVHVAFGFARTKMPGYTLVLFPMYMIAMAHALCFIVDRIIMERYRPFILGGATAILCGVMLDVERLQYRHTVYSPPRPDQCWRQQQLGAMDTLTRLRELVGDGERAVVFNVPALHHIQFMFRTGIEAWDEPPTEHDVARLAARGYSVYAIQDGLPLSAFPHGVILMNDSTLRFPDVGRPNY